MEPKQSEYLSITYPVPESSSCWIVLPKNLPRLPAIILVKGDRTIKPYPVNEDLKEIIPREILKEALDIIAVNKQPYTVDKVTGMEPMPAY